MTLDLSSYDSASHWLNATVPKRPIHQAYTPVPIFHNRKFCGIGTRQTKQDIDCLVTACHIFPSTLGTGFWTYLRPHDSAPRMYPIENAQALLDAPEYDVAVCILPQTIYSPYFTGFVTYDFSAIFTEAMRNGRFQKPHTAVQKFTSLLTGKVYACNQVCILQKGVWVYIIDKHGTERGESGTGFVDDTGALYVLCSAASSRSDAVSDSQHSVLMAVPDFKLSIKS